MVHRLRGCVIALGVFAWIDLAAVTVASTIFVGARLLVGGAFQIIQAIMTKEWRGVVLSLFCGVLYLVGGLLLMNQPAQGALALTLLFAAAFTVGGVVCIVLALQHRDIPAWYLILLSGVVSIIIGYLLYASLPWSGRWILATLIAVGLVVHGAKLAVLRGCAAGRSAIDGRIIAPRLKPDPSCL